MVNHNRHASSDLILRWDGAVMSRYLRLSALIAFGWVFGTSLALSAPQPSAPAQHAPVKAAAPSAAPICNPKAAQTGSRAKRLSAFEDVLAHDGRAAIKAFDCGNGYLLVKSGDARAVALAVKLLRFSDAPGTAHLYDALATAMTKHPENVLAHFREVPRAAVPQFCVPFLPSSMSQRTAFNALKRSDDALSHVTRPDLQEAKAACVREVKAMETKYVVPPKKSQAKKAV
jgi:hypothetical protein